jgi:WD40 repeat protein
MLATASNPRTQQLKQGQVKLWMVLVGVNYYQDSQIPNLRYCANDCKQLAEALTIATQQFQETEIIALYDSGEKLPRLSEIITSIQQFRLAKPEDTVLFYFSGHGYLDSNNRPVLCVADTNKEDLAGTGLKIDILLNELRKCKAQRQLVWLDACQEEQQDNRIRQNTTGQLLAVLEQQAEQSHDFYAMLSCDKTERSWEIPELKHGLFTYCLIEGLRGKAANAEGKIDADSLFRYVERNSNKFIEYKKKPLDANSFSKGLVINPSKPTIPKVKRLPFNVFQTPRRIVKGSGELIIGLANTSTKRRALIVDNLSSSEADISLCRILQAKGNFAVNYYFIKDKHQLNIQQKISSCLQEESNKTVLLYLAGTIESTNPEKYELICNKETRINLNWLRQQLQDSPVQEVVIIADILDTSGINKSLIEILQPNQDKSLCLITASTSIHNSKKFLHQLVTILETAGESSREFWVSELITQFQKWRNSQPDINLKLWLSGSTEVMEILSVEVQRSYDEIFEIDVCPYKSLEAFTQDDTYFFHGREELIAEIIHKLQSTSFLAVVGASGSGKSSVVKAGVIPQLLTKGLFDSESEQFKRCQSWVMLPGDNPIAALAKTLAPDNPDFLEGVLHLGVDYLVKWLHQQTLEISVLVIDQSEELFTLTAETERLNFLNLLLGAIKKARDCFKVIITLRSDFLDECLGMSELAPLITKSEVLVPSCRLEDKQYRQIIAQPAQKVGLEVEDGLIAILLGELKEGSLPLLQYALEELWQKRSPGKLTVKDYQQYIGKLGKFLSNKAQETYNKLSEAQKECAQSIFLSLVFLAKEHDDSNKSTRRRLPISELLVDKYKDVLDSTLQALIEARLIVVSAEGNKLSIANDKRQLNAFYDKENQQKSDLAVVTSVEEETINNQNKDKVTVEVAHEILFRDWETLEEWLEDNRDKYRLIKELKQKANEWRQNRKLDGFLMRKGALAKYEELYVNYGDELSGNSKKFINASIQARDKAEKQAKLRRRWTTGLLTGGITIISLVAAFWQLRQATNNEINTQTALSDAQFAFNQRLNAVVEGTKALRELKKLQRWNFAKEDTQIRVANTLPQLINGVRERNRFDGHTKKVEGVGVSPDGLIVSGGEDYTIKIWNQDGKLLKTLIGHKNWVNKISFSPDGTLMATVSSDETVKLWSFECTNSQGNRCLKVKVELLKTLDQTDKGHSDWVTDVSFSSDRTNLVTASRDGTVKIWNQNGVLQKTISVSNSSEKNEVWGVSFSPDGSTIAAAYGDTTVKLFNLDGNLQQTLEGHSERVRSVSFSGDGKLIVSGSDDNTAIIWRRQDGKLLKRLEGHEGHVNRVKFSRDSKLIATVSDGDNENVKLWAIDGTLLTTFNGHQDRVKDVSFSSDGKTLITGSWDNTVRLWNLDGLFPDTFEAHDNRVMDLAWSPDGKILASASWDKTVHLRRFDGKFIKKLEHRDKVNGVSFSPDNKFIATADSSGNIYLWQGDGTPYKSFEGHNDYIRAVAWSPDSQTLATVAGKKDPTVKLWSRDGSLLKTLKGHKDGIYGVSFSPNSKMIATSSKDNTVKLWSQDGSLLKTLEGHTGWIWNVTWSPDSQLIASASEDSTVKLWKRDGTLQKTLSGHTARVSDVAFSPDGTFIATGSVDATIKLWTKDGRLLTTLEGHKDRVMSVNFHRDGKILASSSIDGAVKLWKLEKEKFTSDLDILLINSCKWVRDYLTYNANISQEDRKTCDGIGRE